MAEPAPLSGRFITALLGVLSAAFLAWAGVVVKGVSVVEDSVASIHTELRVVQEFDRALESRIIAIENRLNTHIQDPWHGRAGNELSRFHAELQALRREIQTRNNYPPNVQ